MPFDVRPDAVAFHLQDGGFHDVRLHQALERPRDGPPFTLRDGRWELTFRRPQVDRLEYGIAADGEERERGAIEFPGYARPAWLDAPDPGPATPVDDTARVWSPLGTPPRAPLPLLVVHDGSAYEREAELTRFVAHAIAAGGRRTTRPAPATAVRWPRGCPASRPPPPTPAWGRASARSPCCTHARCTPAPSRR